MYYNIFYKNIHDLSPFIDFKTNFNVGKTLILRYIRHNINFEYILNIFACF